MLDTTAIFKKEGNRKLEVLLIEDNPGDSELLQVHLRQLAFPACSSRMAESLEAAFEQLLNHSFDLCITDLGLPDSEGLETVQSLCEKYPEVPLIVLTGNNDPELAAAVVREGAQDYLVKGQVEVDQLRRVIRYSMERHAFQSRIRDYEMLLHSSIDALSAEVAILQSDGTIVFANTRWTEGSQDESNPFDDMRQGGNFLRACDHAAPAWKNVFALVKEEILSCLASEGLARRSWQSCVTLESAKFWYEFKITSFEHQHSRHVILSKEDITERRQILERMEFQAKVLDQITDCVTVTDLEGRVTYTNQASCDLLKKSAQELAGSHVESFGENPSLGATQREIIDSTLSLGEWRGEVINITSEGEEVILDCRTHLVYDDDGKPVAMSGISTDITQRKLNEKLKENLRAELNHAQKLEAVGQLAGGIAHDFNNMLQAISGNCELALMEACDNEDLRQELLEIKNASERSANLARQLLAFARRQSVSPRQIDLNEGVSSMLKMLQRLIGENIQLQWTPHKTSLYTLIDPGQLDQILANLAVNAKDAISGQGVLKIELSSSRLPESLKQSLEGHGEALMGASYAKLAVSDTGCGMPQEILDRVFEPFFTTKAVGKGTGLGLSTVYGIVRQNKGFIQVRSTEGKGTTFEIFFLQSRESVQAPIIETTKPLDRGRGRILLVEDEMAILKVTARALRGLGYQVVECSSPIKALDYIKQSQDKVDLLITDVIMPDMNGRQLAANVKSLRPEMPVLYVSGYSADVLAGEGFHGLPKNLLQKPFELKTLVMTIQTILGDPPPQS